MVKSKIFKGEKVYITSGFGKRKYTLNGRSVSDFHYGVDYGTNLKKLPQYAIENGKIKHITTTGGLGNCVYVEYPRIKKIFQHGHLDKILVEVGQTVDNNTIIGYTGQTGQTTGIHLHLGMFPSKDWDKSYYSRKWLDIEKYIYPEKSNDEVAKEVIEGKWANFPKRKKLLESAGYDYKDIQRKVNEILKSKKEIKYTVKRGDTLINIAKKYNTNYKKIAKDNKIANPNLIHPGQKLIIK